jgi:large subunit ribosomal protein L35
LQSYKNMPIRPLSRSGRACRVRVFYVFNNTDCTTKFGCDHKKKDDEMPKMKTKSSAKKRFKITGTGKVKAAAAGKQHGMIKRSNKFIRDARGTMVLSDPDARIVKKFLPNGL